MLILHSPSFACPFSRHSPAGERESQIKSERGTLTADLLIVLTFVILCECAYHQLHSTIVVVLNAAAAVLAAHQCAVPRGTCHPHQTKPGFEQNNNKHVVLLVGMDCRRFGYFCVDWAFCLLPAPNATASSQILCRNPIAKVLMVSLNETNSQLWRKPDARGWHRCTSH